MELHKTLNVEFKNIWYGIAHKFTIHLDDVKTETSRVRPSYQNIPIAQILSMSNEYLKLLLLRVKKFNLVQLHDDDVKYVVVLRMTT